MAGRQAKILTDQQIETLLAYAATTRDPLRNRVLVLLSVKAGLRANEIGNLTWDMVVGPTGEIGPLLELHNHAAKNNRGRRIPLYPDLRAALVADPDTRCSWPYDYVATQGQDDCCQHCELVCSLRAVGLEGCSSHSGRRTFITRAARAVEQAGASLRDVQLLAGHRSIQTTQRYIDGDTDAQRKLVSLI
jgi:integrase/recombinase XerD